MDVDTTDDIEILLDRTVQSMLSILTRDRSHLLSRMTDVTGDEAEASQYLDRLQKLRIVISDYGGLGTSRERFRVDGNMLQQRINELCNYGSARVFSLLDPEWTYRLDEDLIAYRDMV